MNKHILFLVLLAVVGASCASSPSPAAPVAPAPDPGQGSGGTVSADMPTKLPKGVKFKQVQAILNKNCIGCHGGGARARAGINLTSYAKIKAGGEDGPIVKAGNAKDSLLAQALRGRSHARKMPPRSSLKEADIQLVEGWIQDGAKNG